MKKCPKCGGLCSAKDVITKEDICVRCKVKMVKLKKGASLRK